LGSHTILRCDSGPTCNLVDRKKTLIQLKSCFLFHKWAMCLFLRWYHVF
jgi:hypothetical protein